MFENISKEKKINLALLFLVITYVLIFVLVRFFKFDYSAQFGYLDHQLYWEALHRLLKGQKIYKDFYWEYGPLYIYISTPFFLLLGKTFKAYILIRLVFLPLLGFFLSYLLARKLLKGRWLILFLFLGALYSTIDFTTLRHIVAELGLVYAILGLRKNNRKDILIGSFTIGLSLTAGIEYALIAVITLVLYLIWHIFFNNNKNIPKVKHLTYALSGVVIVACLYFGIMMLGGSFRNFTLFFSEFSFSFLTFSPCRSQYPEISKISTSFGFGIKNFWLQVRRWNLYLIPLTMGLSFLYLLKFWKKLKAAPELMGLLIMSAGSYVRVMVNPCLNILAYGVTPILLVFVYLLKTSNKTYKKIFYTILFLLILFSASSGPADLFNLFQKKLTSKTKLSYIDSQKIYIDDEKYKNITTITNYLKENVNQDEYVYVYPYGPYNILTGTKSPSNVIISTHFELAPFLVDKVIENLEKNKPRIVVINEVNTWSYLSSMHQIPEDVLDLDGTPVFMSALTDVERYISQNYKVVNKVGKNLILERRENPVEYTPAYIKFEPELVGKLPVNMSEKKKHDDFTRYEITGSTPELAYMYKDLDGVNLVRLQVRGEKGLFKYSALYLTNLFVLNPNYELISHNTDVLSTEWQDMWLFVPENEYIENEGIVMFRLYNNKGFFDIGGFPRYVDLKQSEFYKLNPILDEAIEYQKQFYN